MKKFIALFTAIIIAGSAHAEEVETRTVTIQVGCPTFSGNHRVLSVATAGGKWEQIPLSIRYPSSPLKVPVFENKLNFYSPDELPTPETEVKPLASVIIPASAKNLYLLLLPSGEEKPAYSAMAIPIDDSKFGGVCMLNALPDPVAMTIDEKSSVIIQRLKPLMITPPMQGESRTFAIRLYQQANPQKPFYSANWNLRRDIRELNIIYLDPKTNRPKIKTIVDMKPISTEKTTIDASGL